MNRSSLSPVVLVAALAMASCASPSAGLPPATAKQISPHHWSAQSGSFQVDLVLGERKHAWPGDDRGVPAPAPSGYRTSYKGPLGEKRIETKSEYSREYVSGYLRSLGTNLQVVVSQEGVDLVIDEKIPNDCCPTNNYTWIAPDSSGKLKATYFQLPQMPTPESPEMGDLPRVTGIRKGILSYRYPGGAQGTVKFSELKKVDRPGPPG